MSEATKPSMSITATENEVRRIREVYARRRRMISPTRYARTDPFNLCSSHEREEVMASLFRSQGRTSLAGFRILDVGCGPGSTLRQFFEYGAEPELMAGIDLLEDNIALGRKLAPQLNLLCGSATQLPFADASFDLITQFTVFTSILDDSIKRAAAAEMARVLAPQGWILWYDFCFDNPANADVKGIRKREIEKLFPDFMMKSKRLTLAPPLGRLAAPFSGALYHLLSRVRPLCTHYMCLLKKNSEVSREDKRDGTKI
jgi:ubiquinone/menaquinone biosynthesis C-methylase UbiE